MINDPYDPLYGKSYRIFGIGSIHFSGIDINEHVFFFRSHESDPWRGQKAGYLSLTNQEFMGEVKPENSING